MAPKPEEMLSRGGRNPDPPTAAFKKLSWSLHFDKRLADTDLRGSQAFARALHRVGILNDAELQELVAALETLRAQAADPAFFQSASAAFADDEDVHGFLIRKLKEVAGPVADKIHTGRSRNEQVSLDTRLWLREQIDLTRTHLVGMLQDLVALAAKYETAVIPGYTHLRRAQPVLWAHYCLAYVEMFLRDVERLDQARARVDVCPLGSGALAGSGFPFDRHAIAQDLGFAAITRNSMDVSGDRDWLMDFLYAASMTMLHLSRLSEDWILYSSDEFNWMRLGGGVTSGSSLMPQKQNPDSLELIRGKCGRVYGALTTLFITMKGTPMTYNRDFQEDKEPLFDAADTLEVCLQMMRDVMQTVTLYPEVPALAAEEGWTIATDLAEGLARAGLPFHQAHKLAGRLVLASVDQGKKPSDWTADELAAFDPALRPEMIALFKASSVIENRDVPGGTAPARVKAALAEARERIAKL